jgi:putative ABC transport system permease protein
MSWKLVALFAAGLFVLLALELFAITAGVTDLVKFVLLAGFGLGFLAFVIILVGATIFSGIAVVSKLLPTPKVPLVYNLRNLTVRWKTTAVTAVAFTLVVSLLTIMLAFVAGMNRLTEGSGIPGNVLVLKEGATDEAFSDLPGGVSTFNLPRAVQGLILTENDQRLESKEVYVIVNHLLANPEPGGRKRRFVQMRGLHDAALAGKVHGMELLSGRWSTNKVHKASTHEVVMGEGVAAEFGKDLQQGPLEPDEVVQIGPLRCIVVGVMKSAGSTFGSEVWTGDELVQRTFGRDNPKSYSSYVVRTQDEETARKVAKLITDNPSSELALQAYAERDYYSKLTETNNQFLFAIVFLAIFMAVGGMLGIMNTMFAAISQRAKDIGVMRLLGFTRWQILMSFLFESLVIALLGGLLGCALGYLADGVTASSIVSSGGPGGGKTVILRLAVTPWILGVGLAFALVMGAVGGLLPSLLTMRLKPLESLR